MNLILRKRSGQLKCGCRVSGSSLRHKCDLAPRTGFPKFFPAITRLAAHPMAHGQSKTQIERFFPFVDVDVDVHVVVDGFLGKIPKS